MTPHGLTLGTMTKAAVLLALLLLLAACEEWEVDKCLDRGGRWNDQTKQCELE